MTTMTKDQAIKKAIEDYSEIAKLEYVSKSVLCAKNMISGLCYYFNGLGYILRWSQIDDRPKWSVDPLFGWMCPADIPDADDEVDVNEIYVKERLQFLKTMDLKPYLELKPEPEPNRIY